MAECYAPFIVEHGAKRSEVPCGRCVSCLKKRVSNWSFRLIQEEKVCRTAHFITLTYDTQNVPITEDGRMTLDKRDLQLYFKRLRKSQFKRDQESCQACAGSNKICKQLQKSQCNKNKISYYAVGEYGSKTQRPHYHLIIFNADIELIEKAWEKGAIHAGNVQGASVGYTLKYIHKEKQADPNTGKRTYRVGTHPEDSRAMEFSLMSKKLGENYINEKTIAWHHADLLGRYYLPYEGKKLPMSRYYRERIYSEEQKKQIANHFKLEKQKEEPKTNKEFRERETAKIAETRRYSKSLKIDKL
jgi:hypothetical protein